MLQYDHQRPWAGFPPEIMQQIFRIACDSSPECARTLCLVNTWTRSFALERVFHTLVLTHANKAESWSPRRRSEPPTGDPSAGPRAGPGSFPEHLGALVRNLWIHPTRQDGHLNKAVFDACRNVENLALSWNAWRALDSSSYLWARPTRSEELLESQTLECSHRPLGHIESPCRSLTVLSSWFESAFQDSARKNRIGCSILTGITHLHIVFFSRRIFPFLQMPRLTHLAVPAIPLADRESQFELIEADLAIPPALRMLVITLELDAEELKPYVEPLMDQDDRLYIVCSGASQRWRALQEAWGTGCQGGHDIWERAKELREQVLTDL